MSKSHLEQVISEAASQFALTIVDVLKSATLEEMLEMQKSVGSRTGRTPAAPAPVAPRAVAAPAAPRAEAPAASRVSKKKKRVVKNYPKCAYPGCDKNRFPRGKGFCGEHWRDWQAGKIKDAESYR